MNNQKLQNFIDLVTFDQNLFSLQSSIAQSEKKLQNFHNELTKIQKKLDDKILEKKELKKNFDLQELHLKDLQEKENNQVSVLERVKNTKECDAASKQVDHIRSERARFEKKLMHTWNVFQAVEKEVEQLSAEHEQQKLQIHQEIVKENDLLQALQQEWREKGSLRSDKIASLPEEWMTFYENMRDKVTNPVVPVAQDSCSACFYSISSRDLQALRQNGLVTCKDCYRFLYLEQSQQDQSENK